MSKHLETLIGTLWSSLRHEAARRRDWLRLAASLPPGASLGWRTEVEGGAISLGERTRIENNASLHCPLRGSDRCHIRIGAHCRVWPGVGLYSAGGWIEIGDYSSLNSHVLVYGRGGVRIGNCVRMRDAYRDRRVDASLSAHRHPDQGAGYRGPRHSDPG